LQKFWLNNNDSGVVDEISEKSGKKWPEGKVRDGEG